MNTRKRTTTLLTGFLIAVNGGYQVLAAEPVELDAIVITASRMAQADYKMASDVSVIGADVIRASTARTVSEVLETQLGVHIYDNSTYKTATVDIRGFGDTASRNVLVLVNDRKVNPIDISGPDLLQIPLDSVERIEIVRGAGSVLYGDNAVGGVVNIITKQGKGDFGGSIAVNAGSYDSEGVSLDVGGTHQDLSYYVFSQYQDNGGYRSNSDLLAKDFIARLGYATSPTWSADMSLTWHEDDYGLPGGLNSTELDQLGRRGSADEEDFASTKDREAQLSLDLAPWAKDVDAGHVVVDFSYRNRDTFAQFNSFGEFGTKRTIDTVGLATKYVFNHPLWERQVNLVTGVDYYTTKNDILGSGLNSDDLTISKDDVGVYVLAEAEIMPRLFFNAGTRFQKAYYTFDQRSGTPRYERRTPDEQVSSAGLRYEYGRGSNVFAGVQETFRFLATDEWYDTFSGLNTDLEQQSGIQLEAGIKHRFNDSYIVSVTPYVMEIEDEIFFDPSAGSFGFGANSNYEETRRVGLEIGQTLKVLTLLPEDWQRPFSQLDLFANYTYQEAEFSDGSNDGKEIPMVPQHQFHTGIRVQFANRIRASLIGRYVGERFAINDVQNATPPVKSYLTLDGKIAYEHDRWQIFLAVNNVTDEKYFAYVSKSSTSDAKDFFPAPERNVQVGVTFRF